MSEELVEYAFTYDDKGVLVKPKKAPKPVELVVAEYNTELSVTTDKSFTPEENEYRLEEICQKLDVQDLKHWGLRREVIPSNIGVRSSHTYRRQLMALVKKDNIPFMTLMILFGICVQVDSATRVIRWLKDESCSAKNMAWRAQLLTFLERNFVQYVSEAERDPSKFPLVNLTSCCPSLAALSWKVMTPANERTVGAFISHKWAAQIRMEASLEEYQLMWEVGFWNNVVKKSNNSNSKAYIKGFQPEFYRTKRADRYRLPVIREGKIVMMDPAGSKDGVGFYTTEQVTWWVNMEEWAAGEDID